MSEAFHRYGPFRSRLDAFVGELPGVEVGDVKAVHHARVASRRLREGLPLLGLDRDTGSKLDRDLRRVTRQLGTVRELDVLLLLVAELQRNRQYSPLALKHLSVAVAHAQTAARKRLAEKLPTSKLERLAHKLGLAAERLEAADAKSRRAGTSGVKRAWLWALDARLARRAARVQSAIRAAGTLYVPEHLHGVRIGLKKLRYAAELSTEARRQRPSADIAVLKAAQDVLGRLHDLEVLLTWGREVQASLSPPDLTVWRELGSLARAVEDSCRELHARYMSDRARLVAIAQRMGARHVQATPVQFHSPGIRVRSTA